MFREMVCFVISWKANKPEQHINIEVCGSGLVILLSRVMSKLYVPPTQGTVQERENG